jgi:hypothetical protein
MLKISEKNFLITVGFGIFLSGCNFDKNTLSAHAECVKEKTGNGLSQEVARGLCSLQHQKLLFQSDYDMTAQLLPYKYDDTRFLFETHYYNKPNRTGTSALITGAIIEITINGKSETMEWEDLWIEPSNSERLARVIKFSSFGLEKGKYPQKDHWEWHIVSFKGLMID